MASSIAQRRALKAAHRRKIVARKRRHDGDKVKVVSVERVRRWAAAPIHCCLIHEGLFEIGAGMVVLARRKEAGELGVASFLVDVYCCGIKDVLFRSVRLAEFERVLAIFGGLVPYKPVEPSYARKLLHDLAGYAQSIGFIPHRDFAAVETLFGDINADACDTAFQFGRDGKPLYMAGPYESQAKIRNTLKRLRQRLGDGGFHYIVPADGIDLSADCILDEILLDQMSPNEIPF